MKLHPHNMFKKKIVRDHVSPVIERILIKNLKQNNILKYTGII